MKFNDIVDCDWLLTNDKESNFIGSIIYDDSCKSYKFYNPKFFESIKNYQTNNKSPKLEDNVQILLEVNELLQNAVYVNFQNYDNDYIKISIYLDDSFIKWLQINDFVTEFEKDSNQQQELKQKLIDSNLKRIRELMK